MLTASGTGGNGAFMEIERVGVIGAGQMGNGIAHVFALAGFEVLLHDVSEAAMAAAPGLIRANMDRQVARGKVTEAERDAGLARIRIEPDLAALGSCDLVIEAATEKEPLKHAIFKALVPHLAPHTILTSNTSSISITRLASGTDRPERFMGFHFMNPVPVMQLVELIRGIATDEPTYETMLALVEKIGKTSSSAEDFPAFIVNRILMPMINEAVYTLYEGRRHRHLDRHLDEARRQPPDGAARARRLHRPRHLPRDHERAARGAGRHQVPPLPAAGEVRRGRLARPQDPPRLLRLSRRDPVPTR